MPTPYEPVPHGRHDDWPVSGLYEPAGHGVQLVSPLTAKLPVLQSEHDSVEPMPAVA